MKKASLVLTVGWSNHSTLKTTGVSNNISMSFSLNLWVCVKSIGKRAIRALRVKCDNVKRKCEWEGTVGTLNEHVAVCKFTPVPCPKQCQENDEIVLIMQKDIDHHMKNECPNRDHKCEYCGEKDTYVAITQIHDKICGKKIISCPNVRCTETMQRQKIVNHVADECQYTEVSCKYTSIGCEVKIERKDMRAHEEDDKHHLHLALGTVVELKDKNVQLQDTIGRLQYGLQLANHKIPLSKKEDETWKKQELTLMTFKLTDYHNKKEHDEVFMSPSFYTSPEGYNMAVRVDTNGSDDGDCRGTHISVLVGVLKGKFDANLKWPFIGRVKVELLNQLADNNHYYLTVSFETKDNAEVGSAWGYDKFIPHFKLSHDPSNNTKYLKDDTLYFRVSVKVSDHKPWLECTVK